MHAKILAYTTKYMYIKYILCQGHGHSSLVRWRLINLSLHKIVWLYISFFPFSLFCFIFSYWGHINSKLQISRYLFYRNGCLQKSDNVDGKVDKGFKRKFITVENPYCTLETGVLVSTVASPESVSRSLPYFS